MSSNDINEIYQHQTEWCSRYVVFEMLALCSLILMHTRDVFGLVAHVGSWVMPERKKAIRHFTMSIEMDTASLERNEYRQNCE